MKTVWMTAYREFDYIEMHGFSTKDDCDTHVSKFMLFKLNNSMAINGSFDDFVLAKQEIETLIANEQIKRAIVCFNNMVDFFDVRIKVESKDI